MKLGSLISALLDVALLASLVVFLLALVMAVFTIVSGATFYWYGVSGSSFAIVAIALARWLNSRTALSPKSESVK